VNFSSYGWPSKLALALLISSIPVTALRAPLFKNEILPVLNKSCVGCHGLKQKRQGCVLAPSAA
jgi:hypothetical protein